MTFYIIKYVVNELNVSGIVDTILFWRGGGVVKFSKLISFKNV